jgi:hypothetical protein
MIGRRHFGAAEILCDLPNASIVRGDDYLRKSAGLLTPFNHMLNERFTRNESEGLSRKTRRTIAGRNDADDFHRLLLAAHKLECTAEKLRKQPNQATGRKARVYPNPIRDVPGRKGCLTATRKPARGMSKSPGEPTL